MGTKKILFVSPFLKVGGVERVLVNYVNKLCEKHEVINLVEFDLKEKNYFENKINSKVIFQNSHKVSLIISNLRHLSKKFFFIVPIFFVGIIFSRFFSKNKLSSTIKKNNPSHIIYFYQFSNFDFFSFSNKYKKIQWLHQSVKTMPFFLKYFFFIRCLLVDRIICISEEMVNDMPKYLKSKCDLIYNPIDRSEIKYFKNPYQNLRNIVSVSRIDEKQKSIKVLIDAFNKFNIELLQNKKYTLNIVGDGPDLSLLKNYVINSKINNIVFHGSITPPFSFIYYSDFLVLSSKFEGFPTILLESIFLNKNFLSSDCKTGPKELYKHGFGKLFKKDDVEDLYLNFKEFHNKLKSPIILNKKKKSYLKNFDIQLVTNEIEKRIL